MLSYTPPKSEADETQNVNVRQGNPLWELAYLMTGILGGLAAVTLVLGLLVNTAVDWLPPSADQHWAGWDTTQTQNPAEQQRLERLLRTLLRASPGRQRIQIHWEKRDEVNAVALPGGHIVIFSGLIDTLKPTDDELAFIIGHETGHIHHRDHWRSFAQSLLWQWLCALVTGNNDTAVGNMGLKSSTLTGLMFSREQELAADQYGLVSVQKAGFNPNGALQFFNHMKAHASSNRDGQISLFMTHPSDAERIDALKRYLKTNQSG